MTNISLFNQVSDLIESQDALQRKCTLTKLATFISRHVFSKDISELEGDVPDEFGDISENEKFQLILESRLEGIPEVQLRFFEDWADVTELIWFLEDLMRHSGLPQNESEAIIREALFGKPKP